MAFVKTFNEAVPAASDNASDAPTHIKDFKIGVNERYELEHNAFDAAGAGQDTSTADNAQGRHIPGKVSCLFSGATGALPTGVVEGAIALDTTHKIFKRYTSGAWTPHHYVPVFRAAKTSTQAVTASTATTVTWDGTAIIDNCSGLTDNTYVAPVTGIYRVSTRLGISSASAGIRWAMVYVDGVQKAQARFNETLSDSTLALTTLLSVTAGQTFGIVVTTTVDGTLTGNSVFETFEVELVSVG